MLSFGGPTFGIPPLERSFFWGYYEGGCSVTFTILIGVNLSKCSIAINMIGCSISILIGWSDIIEHQ